MDQTNNTQPSAVKVSVEVAIPASVAKAAAAQDLYGNTFDTDVPAADMPEDEDMKSIRSGWTMYPAEIEKAISHGALDSLIGKNIDIEGTQTAYTKEHARKAVSQLRAFAGDLGLNGSEIAGVAATIQRMSEQKAKSPREASREEAVSLLNQEHGTKAAKAFHAACAYVAKNPQLGRFLDKTGLGDEPKTVALIARKALQLLESGRMRVKK